MKSLKILLLIMTAFSAGMLTDRHLVKRETQDQQSLTTPRGLTAQSVLTNTDNGEAEGPQKNDNTQGNQRPNPKPSLIHLLSLSDEHAMHRALHNTSTVDLKELIEDAAAKDSSDPQVRELKRVLYGRWAHSDPNQALAAGLKEPDRRLQNTIIHAAFETLARNDLSAAKRAYQQLKTLRQREEAIGAIIHHTTLSDIASVADLVPPSHHEHFYGSWAERDPVQAVAHAEASGQRTEVLRSIAHRWAFQDPDSALQWAQTQSPQVMIGAMHALAEQDPAQAAAWLAEMPPNRETSDLARQVARRWSQEDLDAALDWSTSLTGTMQTHAFQELSHQWANRAPEDAAAFAQSLEPGQARERALTEVAQVWARENLDQAMQWAQDLGGHETTSAMRGIVDTLASENPRAAADLVTQFADQDQYRDMVGQVAEQWSEFQPKAAADWAESLSIESEAQEHAVRNVADQWVRNDPQAASEWIGDLPTGEVRDAATERLVDHIADTDPNAAFAWAMSVSNAEHQQDMLHHVLEQWQNIDPQSAQATFNNANLTSEQLQNLSHIFNNNPP